MKTANDFARLAAELGRAADGTRPPDGDRHYQARQLIVFHIRSAAKQAREIAEALAKTEAIGQ